MPFIRLPGGRGQLFVPQRQKDRKHNCPDCDFCQWCSDARCAQCLKRKKCLKKKRGNCFS